MDYRIRGINGAALRRVRARAGTRLDEGLRRLIDAWAAGTIDPLAEGDPIAAARGAKGGLARAAAMSDEARRASAQRAANARWKDR